MKKKDLDQYKKQAQKTDKIVQKGLMNIYSNKDGSLPDISHLDVKRKAKWKVYLAGILVLAAILAGIYFLGSGLIGGDESSGKKSIELSFESQKSVASGDEVIYVLEYTNRDKVTLHDIDIIFRYPEGFNFISATPQADNDFNTSWSVDSLIKNASGKIEIKGKLIGEVGSIKTINATASYNPENFSSTFKETQSFSNQITSSILELSIEGPDQILPEKKLTYKISYKNNSEQDLESIKILVEYPNNFLFQESIPEAFHNEEDARNLNNQWIIENLTAGQEGEIEITGGFIVDEAIPVGELKVQIGFLDEENSFSLQQEKMLETEILESNLKLDLIINGSTEAQPTNFGQALTYSVIYKNAGEKDLDDVTISLSIDSDIVDWDSLEDKNGGQIEDGLIVWSKEEISELDLLRPSDEGSIDLTINVLPSDTLDINDVTLLITSQAQAGITKIGEAEVKDVLIVTNEISNTINTDLELMVEGRYFNDDNIAVGTGPLPPVVGETTTFRVFWNLANSLHQIKNVRVTTTLPDGVDWEDKYLVGVGDITYSNASRLVTWNVGSLEPNATFDETDVWFDVSVTPVKNQTGRLIILTDQVSFSGVDSVTNANLTKTGKAITSNLEDDPIGGGRGLVIDITE